MTSLIPLRELFGYGNSLAVSQERARLSAVDTRIPVFSPALTAAQPLREVIPGKAARDHPRARHFASRRLTANRVQDAFPAGQAGERP